MFDIDDDALLPREGAAALLTCMGFQTSASGLASRAARGGGPPYSLYDGRALYRAGDAKDWARKRLEEPRPTVGRKGTPGPLQGGPIRDLNRIAP